MACSLIKKVDDMNLERKDSVPKGFTLSMALMDSLPVLFFTISTIFIARHFPSLLFLIGIFFVILAGLLKVSWKLIIALTHRDIRFFNITLSYALRLLAGFISFVCGSYKVVSISHHCPYHKFPFIPVLSYRYCRSALSWLSW